MYDFAVVGVGPAGARFARRAAEAGHDVVAFEAGEIGKPLACSGHVSLDIWDYLPEGARDELFQNAIRGARFHLGGAGSTGHPFHQSEPISNAIDRVGMDKLLAREAERAGADVRDGHTVTGVEEKTDRVVLSVTPDSGDPFEVEARMVAGCDGPRSRVRSALGLPDPGELLHGVLAFDPEPDHDDFVDVHLTIPDSAFFAWRIPRGEGGVEYGLAAHPGKDVKGMFDELVADYGATVEHRCSGAIPVSPPERTVSERGFLIGDAAAQTKPFTGGGILYGMTAADIAAREIDPRDTDSLAAYEAGWRDELEREIGLGKWVRKGYAAPPRLQRFGLELFEGEIGVHMDRPSSVFSTDQLRALFG